MNPYFEFIVYEDDGETYSYVDSCGTIISEELSKTSNYNFIIESTTKDSKELEEKTQTNNIIQNSSNSLNNNNFVWAIDASTSRAGEELGY